MEGHKIAKFNKERIVVVERYM